MPKERILLVDDEPDMIAFIRDALTDDGYEVMTADNGEAVFALLEKKPDLILLDVMMPGLNGLDVCRAIRDRALCPILFLSARHTEIDRIQGLAAGGDDYLVKPFSLRELKARIMAHLRREQRARREESRTLLHDGDLTVDLNSLALYYRDREVPLTLREFEIVQLLALHAGQVFSREQIYEKVWGFEAEGDSATVTEHVKNIRAKLVKCGSGVESIATVWGIGYKWQNHRT
ncbi:response regulator transcription factor [Gorillibacterium timonense]|uniref:response regulator transcription factor n=1 Tax=Gorillibacterium timonense TaxID=1689269 RepID=UPI000AA77430|nr:response regulator transcription factor [Gorillibacterium timonense]